jgi:hypothetical protein
METILHFDATAFVLHRLPSADVAASLVQVSQPINHPIG